MKKYSGWEWLLIDTANQYGMDKVPFEDRITWAQDHLETLEMMTQGADKAPLFQKAVMALRKAQRGMPTGHMVGVDAAASGIQIMSVLTGCKVGAASTGLVDPDTRADIYTTLTTLMRGELGGAFQVARPDAKEALMTSFYGSTQVPKNIFGEDTPELNAFYSCAQKVAPGPWELLQELINTWIPGALSHSWTLPDGFRVVNKVLTVKKKSIEVDELDGSSFTYQYYENEGTDHGLSNAANVIHSVDAYILRNMHRRCNYDREVAEEASRVIEIELIKRTMGNSQVTCTEDCLVRDYKRHYERSSVADIVILPYLDEETVAYLSTKHLKALQNILNGMFMYTPFPIVTIHDDFKSHPNNVDHMRWQYREILAELAESRLLDDLLTQLCKRHRTFSKLSSNLATSIRNSNYALS
jgi:hypothetical protein